MRVSKQKVKQLAKKLRVNTDVVPVDTLQLATKIELEHGLENAKTNVTQNDLEMTFKIALAHLDEYPDYYERLIKMEEKANKYWKRRRKPSIWLD